MKQTKLIQVGSRRVSNWTLGIILVGLISCPRMAGTVTVEGTFVDRPGPNETIVYKYTASLASIVNNVGNLAGSTSTIPRSSQVGWRDPGGAALEGDGRYSNPLLNNGDFNLEIAYSVAPNHPATLLAATVHFTNGVADRASVGGGTNGNRSNTGVGATLKLSGIDQGRLATAGDPVQLATGAATAKRTLFKFTGARDWEFGLTYNSALAAAQDVAGAVGFGWSHRFEARVVVTGTNRVVRFNRTQACTFVPKEGSAGLFLSTDDASRYDVLVAQADGGWLLTRRDQSSWRFDSDGNLVEDRDPHGRILALRYDGSGRVILIEDPISHTRLGFDYVFGTPRISSITDFAGGVVSFGYDSNSLLTTVVNQGGKHVSINYGEHRELLSVTDDAGVVLVSNTYDADGRVISQDDAVADNEVLRFSYVEQALPGCNVYAPSDTEKLVPLPLSLPGSYHIDRFTRVDGKTIEYTYDGQERLVAATVDGQVTTLSYDAQGRAVSVTDSAGQSTLLSPRIFVTATDRTGQSTLNEFDPDFNLLSATNPLAQKTQYTYDAQNNLTSITDALQRVTRFEYDESGNVTRMIDPVGHATLHSYDARNNLLTTTAPDGGVTSRKFDASNNLISLQDALGRMTSWTYDSNSLPLTKTSPRGGVTRYEYSGGQLSRLTDAANVATKFDYDPNGRLLHREDAFGNRTSYAYDAIGSVISITNALREATAFEHDGRNRLVGVSDPTGAKTSFAYDPNGNLESVIDALGGLTTFTYDGEGRRISETDSSEHTILYGYDNAGRLSSLMDATGNITRIEPDSEGQITAVSDTHGTRVGLEYDGRGLLTRVIDPLGLKTTFEYDSAGRQVTQIDALGRRTTLARDLLGNLVRAEDPSGFVCRQTFDEDGERISFADPRGDATALTFDGAGRTVSLTSSEGRILKATYDSRGLLDSVIEPSGRVTALKYDDAQRFAGRVDAMGEITIGRDQAGRVISLSENGNTLSRTYDALGQLKTSTDAEGNAIGYDYDEKGKISRLTYPDGRSVIYGHDAAGRLTTVTDWNGRTTAYSYDYHGRIVGMARPNGTKQVRAYDDAGRLVRMQEVGPDGLATIVSSEFEYDAAGQLTKESTEPAAEPMISDSVQTFDRDNRVVTHNGSSVQFDANGNLLSVNGGFSPQSYVYDARNQLTSAGGISYRYDIAGRRIGMVDSSGLTRFVVNPGEVLDQVLVRTKSDGTRTYYVYGLGILSEETGTSVRYYHCDRRGDTVALTDANGAVTDRMSYGPFGELMGRTGTTDTPFLFSGRWGVQTDGNGLTYHRSRYYHSALRRFLSEDSVLGSVVVPATLNRFAYTRGNPIGFIDPTGYYDADVHHDLTFNLAVRVGFSRCEAEKIAAADQGVDDDETTSPFASVDARRNFHFTTPERRECMLQAANDANDLLLFGQYLHAEQDSYSHQHGQMDRDGDPYGARFGHLFSGHAPDKTAERPELAVKMAETTDRQLRKFYERTHPGKPCDDWENIRPAVEEWVRIPR